MELLTLLFRVGLLTCALLLLKVPAYAQADTQPDEWESDTTLYASSAVDQRASIVGGGGEQRIIQAIEKAFRYPSLAQKKQRQGVAIISFVVDGNGKITCAKVIKGLGYGIDEELIRVTNNLSRFIPAQRNGHSVRVGFTLPIAIQIQ